MGTGLHKGASATISVAAAIIAVATISATTASIASSRLLLLIGEVGKLYDMGSNLTVGNSGLGGKVLDYPIFVPALFTVDGGVNVYVREGFLRLFEDFGVDDSVGVAHIMGCTLVEECLLFVE